MTPRIVVGVDLSKATWRHHFRLKLCWTLLRLIDPEAAAQFIPPGEESE